MSHVSFFATAVAALFLSTAAAHAQDSQSASLDCDAAWQRIVSTAAMAGKVTGEAGTDPLGCLIRRVSVPAGKAGSVVTVDELRFDAATAAAVDSGGRIEMHATGIHVQLRDENPDRAMGIMALNSAFRSSAGPIKGRLVIAPGTAEEPLGKADLNISAPGVVELLLAVDANGISPMAMALDIRRIVVSVETGGQIEAALSTLFNGGGLPSDREKFQNIIEMIAGLPPAMRGGDAVLRYLNAMPRPQGELSLAFVAPAGGTLTRPILAGAMNGPRTTDELAALLKSVEVQATWQSGPQF